MKAIILKFSVLLSIILLTIISTTVSSCKKDQTCHGYVYVHDTLGQEVPLATVRLDAYTINGDITYTAKTDGHGLATFDIALPAIFDIYASKDDMNPVRYGKGSLNVDEPRKEDWKSIIIKQQ